MAEEEILASEEPLYTIGAVTRLTGIPITTLHAWDRRYGFPHPSRTTGGHRLFSEMDIARLRQAKAQIDAGLSTHQAILAAGRLNNVDAMAAARENVPSTLRLVPLPELRQRLSTALVQNDLDRCDQLLGEMLAFYTPEELTLEVILPLLNDIGEGWEAGRISVAAEHLASNYLRQRLLMWMVTGPRPRPARPVILACAPGEWHDGSLLMLGVLLRRQGWPVAYLGQNVPFADLAGFIREIGPAAVVLVAMREDSARALAEWPRWIGEELKNIPLTYGGRAFVVQPELIKTVPGTYLGDTIQSGIEKIQSMLG